MHADQITVVSYQPRYKSGSARLNDAEATPHVGVERSLSAASSSSSRAGETPASLGSWFSCLSEDTVNGMADGSPGIVVWASPRRRPGSWSGGPQRQVRQTIFARMKRWLALVVLDCRSRRRHGQLLSQRTRFGGALPRRWWEGAASG